jgi:hypothetical protein
MRRAERGDCAGSLRRALVAAPALYIWAGPLMAQTSEQVQKAADEAIHRLDLQTVFPRGPEPSSWHLDLPPETLWIVLAIALGILAYAFRDLIPILRAGSGRIAEAKATPPGVTTPGGQALVIEAADELAARGRFVEAMHLLLLHGLAHIRQRLDQQFSDSLTSREILYSSNLSEAARASLRDVVGRVELTYFGQRPAGLADYTACRESFNALGRALYGSAPA